MLSGCIASSPQPTPISVKAERDATRPIAVRGQLPAAARGDQLYDSLVAALGMRESRGPLARMAAAGGMARVTVQRGRGISSIRCLATIPARRATKSPARFRKHCLMMNGPQINRTINGSGRTQLGKLLASTKKDESVTTELYLRCFGREPNKAELETCLTHVKKCKTRTEGFEDVLWALVNSTEFLHRK